jgi:hypothetical protein
VQVRLIVARQPAYEPVSPINIGLNCLGRHVSGLKLTLITLKLGE